MRAYQHTAPASSAAESGPVPRRCLPVIAESANPSPIIEDVTAPAVVTVTPSTEYIVSEGPARRGGWRSEQLKPIIKTEAPGVIVTVDLKEEVSDTSFYFKSDTTLTECLHWGAALTAFVDAVASRIKPEQVSFVESLTEKVAAMNMEDTDELPGECRREVAKQLQLRCEAKSASSSSNFDRAFNLTSVKKEQSVSSADVSRRRSVSRSKNKESSKRPKSSRTLGSIHEPLIDLRLMKHFFLVLLPNRQQPQQPETNQPPVFPKVAAVEAELPAMSSTSAPKTEPDVEMVIRNVSKTRQSTS